VVVSVVFPEDEAAVVEVVEGELGDVGDIGIEGVAPEGGG